MPPILLRNTIVSPLQASTSSLQGRHNRHCRPFNCYWGMFVPTQSTFTCSKNAAVHHALHQTIGIFTAANLTYLLAGTVTIALQIIALLGQLGVVIVTFANPQVVIALLYALEAALNDLIAAITSVSVRSAFFYDPPPSLFLLNRLHRPSWGGSLPWAVLAFLPLLKLVSISTSLSARFVELSNLGWGGAVHLEF